MMTYEAIGLADQNGRTYESKYGEYNKKFGFKLSDLSKSMTKEELLDNLCHENCWSLKKDIKKMTKDEIQKALGYEIEIIGDEVDNKTVNESKEDSKTVNNDEKAKEEKIYESYCENLRDLFKLYGLL